MTNQKNFNYAHILTYSKSSNKYLDGVKNKSRFCKCLSNDKRKLQITRDDNETGWGWIRGALSLQSKPGVVQAIPNKVISIFIR